MKKNRFILAAALVASAFSPLALGDDRAAVAELEKSTASLAAAGDYQGASSAAFRLAEARHRLGEAPQACAALSKSLEYYREANAPREPALSGIGDDSDGMAKVRAKFGC